MPQQIGQTYRSLVPTFSDAASIEEALKLYHYGVANYTSQPIPDDSIEGNFRKLKIQIDSLQTTLDNLQSTSGYVRLVSQTSSPNVITSQSTGIVPLTVRAIVSQTSNLQEWTDFTGGQLAAISTSGQTYINNYLSLNSTSFSSTTALSINVGAAAHIGIVVRSSASQSANLQEWRDSGNNVLSSVSSTGNISAPNISGSTSITSPKISTSGTQTLTEARVRNTYVSTSNPTALDGQIGEIWLTYTA